MRKANHTDYIDLALYGLTIGVAYGVPFLAMTIIAGFYIGG